MIKTISPKKEKDNFVFFDMDGVLAQFPAKHGETGTKNYKTEKGFFQELKPYIGVEVVNDFLKRNKRGYIITTSPNEQADKDKLEWLKIYMPDVEKEQVLFSRGSKADVVKEMFKRELTKNDILIDDFTKNLNDWADKGGTGVKRRNGINCKGKNVRSWKGLKISRLNKVVDFLVACESNGIKI